MDIIDILKENELVHIFPKNNITRSDIENLFDKAFFEIGASGKTHHRESCINTVVNRCESNLKTNEWKTTDFQCQEISKNCYLLTYVLTQENKNSRTKRASIWRYKNECWKILYHQGTIVS